MSVATVSVCVDVRDTVIGQMHSVLINYVNVFCEGDQNKGKCVKLYSITFTLIKKKKLRKERQERS